MVAAVTERHSGDQLARREALGRKPSGRIGKGRGTGGNDEGNERQRPERGRLVGRCHWGLAISPTGLPLRQNLCSAASALPVLSTYGEKQ